MKISCIMPTTPSRKVYFPVALKCFLNQTYAPEDLELVILDDNGAPIEWLFPDDPRIRCYHRPGRLTVGAKKNLLCEMANGEVIVQWDDDDWYAPQRIEKQIEWLRVSQKPVTGFHRFFYWDEVSGKAYEYIFNGVGNYASGSTQCYLKTWWEKHKFQCASVAEDSAFSFEAERAGALFSVDADDLMVARGHHQNTWRIPFGAGNFPATDARFLPAQFFQDIKENDLTSVVKQAIK